MRWRSNREPATGRQLVPVRYLITDSVQEDAMAGYHKRINEVTAAFQAIATAERDARDEKTARLRAARLAAESASAKDGDG